MDLSVNLNKIALLRNSRGSNSPSLEEYAKQAIALGIQGITLHPRPDHRHATSQDALSIAALCKEHSLEFNLEGNPFSCAKNSFMGFLEICAEAQAEQITLVPDAEGQLTSDSGWQPGYCSKELQSFLRSEEVRKSRTSLFINADVKALEYANKMEFDRVEIYTGPFALACRQNNPEAIKSECMAISAVIKRARELGVGVNAGHDLNLDNIPILKKCGLVDEVSIGHAIITDTLKYGFEDTIIQYLHITREI